MLLNVYKRTPGKPMIYSSESALNFLLQTKNTYIIRTRKGYIKIRDLSVGIYEIVDEWTEVEVATYKNGDAVKWAYQNRKIINARF